MRDIYKAGKEVLVWLGLGAGVNKRSAFTFLCDLAAREKPEISKHPRQGLTGRPETRRWIKKQTNDRAGIQKWSDLADLLDSP